MTDSSDPTFVSLDPPRQADAGVACARSGSSTSSTRRSSTSRCRRFATTCTSRCRASNGSLSGYLLTYGGFMLLGGRAADLIGRRRLLVSGTALFALSSLAGGCRGQRGAADRGAPGAGDGRGDDGPSRAVDPDHILREGSDRTHRARRLGRAGRPRIRRRRVPRRRALAGGRAGAGCSSSTSPSARLILVAAFRLIPGEHQRARLANFDALGAIPRDGRDAAAGVRPRERSRRGLGQGANDRRVRRRGGVARRIRGATSSATATRSSLSPSFASTGSAPPTP